jgi:hypothetical protein
MTASDWAIPDGWEQDIAEEWLRLISQGKKPDQLGPQVPLSPDDLEATIHPHAEAYIEAYDAAGRRLDAGLSRSALQFCHCLSQVVAGRLLTYQEILGLPIGVIAALALSAVAGWQASAAHGAGLLTLPPSEIDPDDTAELL